MIARVSSLCSQMTVESDLERPSFFDMCSENRMIGGPNPDGNYYLAMIRGDGVTASPEPAAPAPTWDSRSWPAPD